VTGQDILFFWVARMMMMQLAVVNDIPFHTVYLHGLVRDAKGKKMSKSLGQRHRPVGDHRRIRRRRAALCQCRDGLAGGVLKLDTQRIAGYRNFGTKLWNACRFAEMNGVWEGHATGPAPSPKATANRWIIGETARTLAEVNEALQTSASTPPPTRFTNSSGARSATGMSNSPNPCSTAPTRGNPRDDGLGAGPVA
jgi:valyl-tRNA synthetase